MFINRTIRKLWKYNFVVFSRAITSPSGRNLEITEVEIMCIQTGRSFIGTSKKFSKALKEAKKARDEYYGGFIYLNREE